MGLKTLNAAWRRTLLHSIAFFLLVIPASATVLPVQGGPGGGSFVAECPRGQFLVGISVRSGYWIDAIFPLCAPFLANQRKFGNWTRGPRNGGTGGSRLLKDAVCPSDRYVSGILHNYTGSSRRGSMFVVAVRLTCSPVAGGAATTLCLRGKYRCGDIPSFNHVCPANEAATGIHGRSGAYVDALGLICGPKPPPPPPSASVNQTPTGKPKGPPIKMLGKVRRTTIAKSNVDIYDNPTRPRRVIGMMRGGAAA